MGDRKEEGSTQMGGGATRHIIGYSTQLRKWILHVRDDVKNLVTQETPTVTDIFLFL